MTPSDLDTLKDMLKRAKIDFTEETRAGGLVDITVYGGYAGFMSVYTFKPDGSLLKVGAYE